jgi:hypothetical protein
MAFKVNRYILHSYKISDTFIWGGGGLFELVFIERRNPSELSLHAPTENLQLPVC